jgi:hypothetical protein
MKSIAYTLSVLLLGATFACADESKAPTETLTEVSAPANKTAEATTPAKSEEVEVLEEIVEEEPAAPAKK